VFGSGAGDEAASLPAAAALVLRRRRSPGALNSRKEDAAMHEQLNPRWTWTAIALALVAGVGAGRLFVGSRDAAGDRPAAAAAEPAARPSPAADAPARPVEPGITRFQVPVTVSQPAKGSPDALVTIVQWCDFESAGCRAVEPVLDQVQAAYADKLRWVFRHFAPPSLEGRLAHQFAQIAHDRADKFWLAKQKLLQTTERVTLPVVERIAKELGMDWPSTRSALEAQAFGQHVDTDALFAKFFEVAQAPAFFVNGRRLGEPTLAGFRALIDDELRRAQAMVDSGVPRNAVYANLIKGGKWTRPPELDAPAN
jgi:protein-disulfide isomerase